MLLSCALYGLALMTSAHAQTPSLPREAQLGPRPFYLVDKMKDGPLSRGGGFFHSSVKKAIDRDGDTMTVLDVLAQQVGLRGLFSDWPATTTFYASW
jgi:hypothetical protein